MDDLIPARDCSSHSGSFPSLSLGLALPTTYARLLLPLLLKALLERAVSCTEDSQPNMAIVNGQIPHMEAYPPAPILWITATIDSLCLLPIGCADWRKRLHISESSWWHARVPPLLAHVPPMLTYHDFLSQQPVAMRDGSAWGRNLYTFCAHTSSTSLGNLATPAAWLVLVALIFLLRTVKKFLLPRFSAWGRVAGRRTHGVAWEARNEERIAKFGEYVFRLFFHSTIAAYGVVYFWDKEWWKAGGTLSLFAGFPHHPVEPGMTWYYLLQAAYNMDAMLSLLELSLEYQGGGRLRWSKTVRGDFREMFIHHVVTNLLVVGSSVCRLTRIGSMVFLVHDLSDVPVDLSKLCNFLKWKVSTLVCFFSMVLVWLATRLYILPVTIYGAILTQSQYLVQDGLPVLLYVHYRYMFYILVGLLIILHLAWFVMFLQMLGTFVKRNECHDLSEHKGGEVQPVGKAGGNSNGNGSPASSAASTAVSAESTTTTSPKKFR